MLLVDEDVRHGTLAGDFLKSVLDRGAVVCFFRTNIASVRYVYFISFHAFHSVFLSSHDSEEKSKKRILPWHGMVGGYGRRRAN